MKDELLSKKTSCIVPRHQEHSAVVKILVLEIPRKKESNGEASRIFKMVGNIRYVRHMVNLVKILSVSMANTRCFRSGKPHCRRCGIIYATFHSDINSRRLV